MVETKNVTLSEGTFVFNGNNLADYLKDKQIVYIKGFAANNIEKNVTVMYDELHALLSKSRDLVVAWDGDEYNPGDFTLFIEKFIERFIHQGQKRLDKNKKGGALRIDIMGEPSGTGNLAQTKVNGLQSFLKINGLVEYLKGAGGVLASGVQDWQVKGMALTRFLSTVEFDASIKRPIVVYCIGGGATPKMEHQFVYGGDVSKLLSTAPAIGDASKINWYLSTPNNTHSRVKGDNTVEITHLANPEKVSVTLHGTVDNMKMADNMLGKSARSAHRVGKKLSKGAKAAGRKLSSGAKKVSSKIKKMRADRKQRLAEKKARKEAKAAGETEPLADESDEE
jgi:hypothetical protein